MTISIEDVDLESMSESDMIRLVDYAVQAASRCKTAIFDWLCVRAYTNYPDFTESELALQRALEKVRHGYLHPE